MSSDLLQWFRLNPVLTGWIFLLSALLFFASLASIPFLVTRMRADYLVTRRPRLHTWRGPRPVLRWVTLILKNAAGALLLLAGLAMLLLPGQGLITILAALSLLDFPGKRWLEAKVLRQRHVLRAINWVRSLAKQRPLLVPDDRSPGESRSDPG